MRFAPLRARHRRRRKKSARVAHSTAANAPRAMPTIAPVLSPGRGLDGVWYVLPGDGEGVPDGGGGPSISWVGRLDSGETTDRVDIAVDVDRISEVDGEVLLMLPVFDSAETVVKLEDSLPETGEMPVVFIWLGEGGWWFGSGCVLWPLRELVVRGGGVDGGGGGVDSGGGVEVVGLRVSVTLAREVDVARCPGGPTETSSEDVGWG